MNINKKINTTLAIEGGEASVGEPPVRNRGERDPNRRIDREIEESFRENPQVLAGPEDVWQKEEERKLIYVMEDCQDEYWERISQQLG